MENTNNKIQDFCSNIGITQNIEDYFDTFNSMLIQLGLKQEDNNLVFAGVMALKAHGLKMSRPQNDLDCVIFKPTTQQLNYLTNLAPMQYSNPFGVQDYEANEQFDRSMKFQMKGLIIDFLFSQDFLPQNLLYYKHHGIYYKIQDIALNIKAKNSYQLNQPDRLINYRRDKDMKDLIDLKNSNFNF